MKITIDVECTPEEARTFFGLPDLSPVHDAMVEKMVSVAKDGISPSDMEALMRAWMPGTGQNWQAMQKAFWSGVAKASDTDD